MAKKQRDVTKKRDAVKTAGKENRLLGPLYAVLIASVSGVLVWYFGFAAERDRVRCNCAKALLAEVQAHDGVLGNTAIGAFKRLINGKPVPSNKGTIKIDLYATRTDRVFVPVDQYRAFIRDVASLPETAQLLVCEYYGQIARAEDKFSRDTDEYKAIKEKWSRNREFGQWLMDKATEGRARPEWLKSEIESWNKVKSQLKAEEREFIWKMTKDYYEAVIKAGECRPKLLTALKAVIDS